MKKRLSKISLVAVKPTNSGERLKNVFLDGAMSGTVHELESGWWAIAGDTFIQTFPSAYRAAMKLRERKSAVAGKRSRLAALNGGVAPVGFASI